MDELLLGGHHGRRHPRHVFERRACRRTEVAQPPARVALVQDEILGLDVAVRQRRRLRVEVGERERHIGERAHALAFGKRLAPLGALEQQLRERAAAAQLE